MYHLAKRARVVLFALCATLVLSLGLSGVVGAEPADYSVTGGWFYSQAGGGQGNGYSVLDAGTDTSGSAIKFFTEFKRLGGVSTLGYPVGQPYKASDGFVYQPFQRGVLQWRPELGRAFLANTFEQLQNASKDSWLNQAKGIPAPVVNDGSNGDYNAARSTRLGWLTNSAIKAKFLANPNPQAITGWSLDRSIEMYGLPMSQPEQHGPFISQRFQRIAFQLWTDDVAGMPAKGTVVGVLGGDLLKEAGLLPGGAIVPLGPGGSAPAYAPTATPVPATPVPVASFPYGIAGYTAATNCGTTYARVYVQDANGNGLNGMSVKTWNDWGNEQTVGTRNYMGRDGYFDRVFGAGPKSGKWYAAVVDGSGRISSETATMNFTDSCLSGGVQEIEVIFKQGASSTGGTTTQPTATPAPAATAAPIASSGGFGWRVSNQQGWANCGTTYIRAFVRDSNGNGLNGYSIKSWNDWGNEYMAGTANYNGTDGHWDRIVSSGVKSGKWYVAMLDGSGNIASQTATVFFTDSCVADQGNVQEVEIEFKPN